MKRHVRKFLSLALSASVIASGCKPTQPYYFKEDGDLSHYLDVATDIEYPDVDEPQLEEVTSTLPPLTLKNADAYVPWDLSLEEVVRITLCNSQVMRQVGARVQVNAPDTISRTLINPVVPVTAYDPALMESSYGLPTGVNLPGATGVEAALSEFDARWDASVSWEKNRQPQNRPDVGIGATFFPPIFDQDLGTFTSGITKTTADGTTFSFRNNTNYELNNVPASARALPSDWNTNFEASFSRPLLQGAGTQYNRIAGIYSFDQHAARVQNPIDGVVIARINTDLTLADFEGAVRNLTRDAEEAYWELYFSYRDLEARKFGRDSALETWKKTAALFRTGSRGGSADREAQARSQYFLFRAQVEEGLTNVFRAENRLRYIMGLSMSDGRLIRPSDEPTTARVAFDWCGIQCEALSRQVEVRKEKWNIKKRELELIAARNHLLPRLDAFGRYRWRGLGDDLIDPARGQGEFNQPGSTAFGTLTGGDFQEWQLGLELSVPIGFREQLAAVRHHELLLARERALMQDLELEVTHQLGDAVRDLDLFYGLTQTNFNRRVAAEKEVQAVQASYDADRVTLDLLLQAQQRRAEAESAYYRSLVDYNRAIMNVHYRKGSLLDYNDVYLAEGAWPGKAYFDALRQARKRDASMYLDYGFTRPNVFSRGPYPQHLDEGESGDGPGDSGTGPTPSDGSQPGITPDEQLPSPMNQTGPVMPLPLGSASATTQGPGASADYSSFNPLSATDERQTNHAAVEIATDSAIWRGPER
jgi:outer membrane protein TolC